MLDARIVIECVHISIEEARNLRKPRTAFRQPKGAKHAPKHPTTKEVNDRAWREGRRRRNERWTGDDWRTPSRSFLEHRAIEEELFHARELHDLAAIEHDGFERYERNITYGTYTVPQEPKEASMTSNDLNPTRAILEGGVPVARTGSIAQPRPSGRVAKGRPWRDDCRIQPEVTLLVEPDAPARDTYGEPIDPTTRKATPVLPPEPLGDGEWSLDDIIDDRRLVRLGG